MNKLKIINFLQSIKPSGYRPIRISCAQFDSPYKTDCKRSRSKRALMQTTQNDVCSVKVYVFSNKHPPKYFGGCMGLQLKIPAESSVDRCGSRARCGVQMLFGKGMPARRLGTSGKGSIRPSRRILADLQRSYECSASDRWRHRHRSACIWQHRSRRRR